jgi:GAF domain-containing protein
VARRDNVGDSHEKSGREEGAVFTKRFARELMQLGRLEASPEVSLDRITALAARDVPGCAGAGAMIWLEEDVVQSAASHPDTGALVEFQYTARAGPQWEARQSGQPMMVAETMAEDRWPRYALAALGCGVRSSLAVPLRVGATVVTIGLDAVRPRAFDEPAAGSLAVLLAEQITVALGNTERYEAAAREAAQMRRALDSWSVVSEAKGVLMQTQGLDADAAFDWLRRVSQGSQVKLADVARRLIEDYANRDGSPPRDPDRSPE